MPTAPDPADEPREGLDESADSTTDALTVPSFGELGLDPVLAARLETLNHHEPTPIQAGTIPLLLEGRDLLGQAATGTGKTAAFGLPLIQALSDRRPGAPGGLILAPTRELAVQVAGAIRDYAADHDLRIATVYGGASIVPQLRELSRGVHLVVATPGRALDHVRRGSLDLSSVTNVVLDEADEMLDMGFLEDLEAILDECPTERQTVLFSATLPPRIRAIANRYLNDPESVRIGSAKSTPATELVDQSVVYVDRRHKAAALGRLLDTESPSSALIFCPTRDEVDELSEQLAARGYRAEALHGGLGQPQRDRVMSRLRQGTAQLLIATDVAARGLDVDTLTHVINYGVPTSPEVYVHRVGRVGRAGRQGRAITLAEPRQRGRIAGIERLTRQTVRVEPIPSVEQARWRQAEQTTRAVREFLAEGDLAGSEPLLHDLAGDGDPRTIALAALALLHAERNAHIDDEEIPAPADRRAKKNRKERTGRVDRPERSVRDRGANAGRTPRPSQRSDASRSGDPSTGMIYVGLGAEAGVRPKDVVGAIANQAGLDGRDIGPIKIGPHHTSVGVPEGDVERVISALRATTLRGRKIKARRWQQN